jgi:hypothetical protein
MNYTIEKKENRIDVSDCNAYNRIKTVDDDE